MLGSRRQETCLVCCYPSRAGSCQGRQHATEPSISTKQLTTPDCRPCNQSTIHCCYRKQLSGGLEIRTHNKVTVGGCCGGLDSVRAWWRWLRQQQHVNVSSCLLTHKHQLLVPQTHSRQHTPASSVQSHHVCCCCPITKKSTQIHT